MSLAEKITLLLLNDRTGSFTGISQLSRDFALGGAVILELVIEKRLNSNEELPFVIDAEPLNSELLDPLLSRIAQSSQSHDMAHWIRDAAGHAEDIFKSCLMLLIEQGVLSKEERQTFGVRRTNRYTITDSVVAGEPKKRILNVLSTTDIPDMRDAVLISLTHVCGILDNIFSSQERRSTAERIYQIRKMDMFGRTVSRALVNIEAELVGRLY